MQKEQQAIGRVHRLTSISHVFAYRLIAKDSVEQKIRALQAAKSATAERVICRGLKDVYDVESLRKIFD